MEQHLNISTIIFDLIILNLKIYAEKLVSEDVIKSDSVGKIEKEFLEILNSEFNKAKEKKKTIIKSIVGDNWLGLNKAKPADFLLEIDTRFEKK